MPKAAWFTFGGGLMFVALKVLFDSVGLAFVLVFFGALVMILAHRGVLGKDANQVEAAMVLGMALQQSPASPVLPNNRPKVVPDRYGVSPQRPELKGLYVVNYGEPAHDVAVAPIPLGEGGILEFEKIHHLAGRFP